MARQVQIVVPHGATDSVLDHARGLKGIGNIQLQKNGSSLPAGDVVTVSATNDAAIDLIDWLRSQGIGYDDASSIITSEPGSVVSKRLHEPLEWERNNATLEETDDFLHKVTAPDIDTYMIMFGAGVFTATGIMTDQIYLAIAGFILAPGFQPLFLFAFGVVNRTRAWKRGLRQSLLMYLALLAGAVLTAIIMPQFGHTITNDGLLLEHWSTLSGPAFYIAAAAGFVGTFVISSRQDSLIPAITTAAALIPSISIAGIAGIEGDWVLAGKALVRWSVEVAMAVAFSAMAFALKKRFTNVGAKAAR